MFFEQAFLQPFLRYMGDSGVAAKALGQLALEGLVQGENRFPITWSESKDKIRRICGWTVSPEHPKGDTEAASAILKFWTSDLQALSAQMRQAPNMPSHCTSGRSTRLAATVFSTLGLPVNRTI